jgi:hypothetical protein
MDRYTFWNYTHYWRHLQAHAVCSQLSPVGCISVIYIYIYKFTQAGRVSPRVVASLPREKRLRSSARHALYQVVAPRRGAEKC